MTQSRAMHFVFFYHSLVSDWNHGNAHFLRGVAGELLELGHRVTILEPHDGWSARNLREEQGSGAITDFYTTYPRLRSRFYELASLDLDEVLGDADVVLVHEWNDPTLVTIVGQHRALTRRFRLLFHDTHHRMVSEPRQMDAYDLSNYDGVLAFGEVLRQLYEDRGSAARAWTWHEAADVKIFHPVDSERPRALDLIWIGNWGDGERADELDEFLIEPVRTLALRARVHGVRYPEVALRALQRASIEYGGWIANFHVPQAYAEARATVHIPRRFYREMLPGIPTIRMFEALACGIPLVSAPWEDAEHLFEAGRDYLVATDGGRMTAMLHDLLHDGAMAGELSARGQQVIRERHTCAHRVQELLTIVAELNGEPNPTAPAAGEPAAAAH
jgi:spore maturation protein CgeB